MSAIFGIWNINGEPVKEKCLRKMEEKLRHYGRDEQDIWIDGNIGLGSCLSKIGTHSQFDVAVYDNGLQQMIIVGDALIFNRSELIGKYGLTDDKNISTQGLLFEAYRKWGTDCAKNINGDFAFVIWEKQRKQLLIFRDHLGIRPLYYFFKGTTFAFATDVRALLALPFLDHELDETELYASISKIYHIDPEATSFAKIKRLPQAHWLKVDANGISKHKYWTPGEQQMILAIEEQYVQKMFELVTDAIKIRVAGQPAMGAELSGGLDSSVIVILANRELRKENKSLALASWLVSYELLGKQPNDSRKLNESVCRQEEITDCLHYDPRIPIAQKFTPLLPGLRNGRPFLCEYQHFASRGVRQVLTGWGGDEAISYRCNMYGLLVSGDWRHFWEEACFLAKGSLLRLGKILISNTIFPLFSPYSLFGNSNKAIPDIVNRRLAARMKRRFKKDILYYSINPVKNLQSGGIQSRTELTAWVGAHYNIQHLYPFLDYRVVDFAMSIPRHWFRKRGLDRYIYRKAFAGILPPEFEGISPKEDQAALTYLQNTLAENADEMIQTARRLRRDWFEAYIDWSRLEAVLKNPKLKTDKRLCFIMNERIKACYNVQQILEEADRDLG